MAVVMSSKSSSNPNAHSSSLFKGIALFTPGGDLVYSIDPLKQNRWHLQLCAVLQEMLGLSEPPHFLVPCYTATVDRWLDPQTQQIYTTAEACPLVLKHQAILNVVFDIGDTAWLPAFGMQELCDPVILASYRNQFPQLWEDHDLVVRFERAEPMRSHTSHPPSLSWIPAAQPQESQGYVLRLFVSGNIASTERILQNLHHLLDQSLQQPYTLKVVDIYKHPELAEANQVTATPALVRVWPLPIKRVVGDLSDARILQILTSSF
jgi:circadian clock protein KaiB